MSNYDVYGIGAALVDTEIEVSDADLSALNIEKGVMTLVDEARQAELLKALKGHLVASKRASGGSAANTVIAASYFGSKTFYSCKVANDENGEFYLNDLKRAGVEFHSTNGSDEGVTGKCLVMITSDAERTMNTFLGISETISESEIDVEALKQSKYAYIEGYLVTSATGLPAAKRLKALADEHKVKTAVSLSDPAIVNYFKEGLQSIVGEGVDLLFCNADEAMNFTSTSNVEEACEALKRVAKTFAVTRGAEGALVFDGNNLLNIEAKKTKAIDTNGAGDMFAGAFLHAITKGSSFKEAGALASRAAAKVVSQFGPRLKPEQHAELLEA